MDRNRKRKKKVDQELMIKIIILNFKKKTNNHIP
jgi:hypothetical protein